MKPDSLNIPGSATIQKITRLLAAPTIEPSQRAARIQTVEKDIILPLKAVLILILTYFFFFSHWRDNPGSPTAIALALLQWFFVGYIAINLMAGILLLRVNQISLPRLQWLLFGLGLLDVALMAGLTFLTDGSDSYLYWVFPVLILHNALAIPVALPQLFLNCLLGVAFVVGAALDQYNVDQLNIENIKNKAEMIVRQENRYERVIVLLLWASCCYGIQLLFERQKRAEAEATEFAVRQERLQTAGRLAAEIAHQIKNPLAIITNAAFCLQRAAQEGQTAVDEQVGIIREEVERADQIITELMGYAQLAEGRVERLDVTEELDSSLAQVFPSAAKFPVEIRRDYEAGLPALLMQKRHLSDILVNLLQNAREAMNGHGEIEAGVRYGKDDSITILIGDNGPGIAPEKIDRIFEAYFTTREKGTGLGLAIVKHNIEMYGGKVKVESTLGKGTRFMIDFPPRIQMKLPK
ncbi:MAG TPA: ATP-binding protein [Verrucomicrobiae bacterium]|nr:ATP-binding protein [Verrucomicrobiae bacterium]